MSRATRSSRRSALAVAAVGLIALGSTACGSSGKKATDQVRDKASEVASQVDSLADSAADEVDSLTSDSDTGASDSDTGAAALEPCKGITADKVSDVVGFEVEGDGEANDNGIGFVSCQFKAGVDDPKTMGAVITLGLDAEPPESTDEIRKALSDMTNGDVKPTEVQVGDGGYLLNTGGSTELRAIVNGKQVTASIVTPMDDATDRGEQTVELAKLVADNA